MVNNFTKGSEFGFRIMIRTFGIIIWGFLFVFSTQGQTVQHRDIMVYDAVVRTNTGNIKGVLYRVAKEGIEIQTGKGNQLIPVERIKSMKIKFAKKETKSFTTSLVHEGINIATDPMYAYTKDSNGRYRDRFGQIVTSDEAEEMSLGESVLAGTAVIAGGMIGHELYKIAPRANIETFKIKYSKDRYDSMLEQMSMYSTYFQSSPEYEFALKKQLKEVLEKNKLEI